MSLSAGELVADRFRQIHLDFHTSPLIPDVGADFDADRFGDTLTEAHVNWVTVFGKCHHGMSYYPTRVGTMHPSLKFDLMGAQIEACRKRGIAAPVYISVRVDQHIGTTRPDLVVRLEDGKLWGPNAHQASWYQICLNKKEYIDYVAAQTEEVLKQYDADGIFYDMCYYPPDPGCFCETCLKRLQDSGSARTDKEAHRRQTFQILREYTTRLTKICRDIRPEATTFFNSRVTPNVYRELDTLSQLEIESLTTGGWGYLYFPTYSRVMRTYPRPIQGMTARFHKSWADFGGLKTTAQLDYEAATILAAGAVVNIGDQLHPRGTLDTGAYSVIGKVYSKIAAVEEYCRGAEPQAEIAVLLLPPTKEAAERQDSSVGPYRIDASIEGAAAILNALNHQWNGETADRDNLDRYRLVIIPDAGCLTTEMKAKLDRYQANGGAVLFSHQATLSEGEFALSNSPVRYAAPCPWTPSYMRLGEELGSDLPNTEYVQYRDGSYVEPLPGAEPMGEVWQPYFNRAPEHFSSHAQTPADKPTGYPVAAISSDGKVAYVYGAIFQGYREDAFYIYKEIAARLLNRLMPNPIVRAVQNVPPSMEVSVLRQKQAGRTLVHLVSFTPTRRTAANEFIEEAVPVADVTFALRTGEAPTAVTLVPSGESVEFRQDGEYCIVTVPKVVTSQIVCFTEPAS